MKVNENDSIPRRTQTRDGRNESLWQAARKELEQVDDVDQSIECDTLIVGAGITGITTALLLQKAGQKCVVAEAHNVGFGTSSGTSAHINNFVDTTFAEVQKAFNAESAQLFADVISESVSLISENVKTYDIDCDFEWKNGYIYAETENEAEQLRVLYEGAVAVGVKASHVTEVPINVPFRTAVVFEKQAQFHPVKYLCALATEFVSIGGQILENAPVEKVETADGIHLAKAGGRDIHAKHVVYATHIPPGGINVLHFRNAPYRSYVIAAKLSGNGYPQALVYDMQDPYHYFRTHTIDGQQYLIVGGGDHKTGHGDPDQAFSDLEHYLRQYYQVDEVSYKWSAQYYVPADGLPYVGQLPGASDHIYAATGFNGNGMTLGTVSAIVMSDLILKKTSRYESLFDPGRIKPIAGFTEIVKESADVAYHFIADRFAIEELESFKTIPTDSGAVVEYQNQKLAVHKDLSGEITALNPVCTHAKCIVNWNDAEKSWDCPCHGARFDKEGVVLTGPARENLEKVIL